MILSVVLFLSESSRIFAFRECEGKECEDFCISTTVSLQLKYIIVSHFFLRFNLVPTKMYQKGDY